MPHMQPQPGCGCCDGEPPCLPPVVTCEINYGFDYTVQNATFAEIRIWCPSNIPGAEYSTAPVTLDENGSASGTYGPIDVELCTYCIFASNDCADAICCRECDMPCCSINIEFLHCITPVHHYTVRWTATALCPTEIFTTKAIVDVRINGVSQEIPYHPFYGNLSGFFHVPFGDPTQEWCIEVEKECGNVRQCCVTVPCCYTVNATVLEGSGWSSTYQQSCTGLYGPFAEKDTIDDVVTISGLNQLNGTRIFGLPYVPPSECGLIDGCVGTPLNLGYRVSVEYWQRYTYRESSFDVDFCGNSLAGYTRFIWYKYTGDLMFDGQALSLYILIDDWEFIAERPHSIISGGPSGCITDPYGPCEPGYNGVIWDQDSRYCKYHVTSADIGTVVGFNFYGFTFKNFTHPYRASVAWWDPNAHPMYGYGCPVAPDCRYVPTEWCLMTVNASGIYPIPNSNGTTAAPIGLCRDTSLGATSVVCDAEGRPVCHMGHGLIKRPYHISI